MTPSNGSRRSGISGQRGFTSGTKTLDIRYTYVLSSGIQSKREDTMTQEIAAKPMLVSEIPGHRGRILAQPHVFVQPKLDGWCCMANTRTRRIYTRSGAEITTLPHINAALPAAGPEWLHGELWAYGLNSDNVQSMVKRGDASIQFHVFDCVSEDGWSNRDFMVDCFCSGRRMAGIHTVDTFKIKPVDIPRFYRIFINDGYEGIIIRLDGHGYEHKRSINVFKMKPGTEGV
jgi:ATP-dependent DNA ligase